MSKAQNPTDSVQPKTDELADAVDEHLTVPELRSWMSSNDLSRTRGASKAESIQQAIQQDVTKVEKLVHSFEAQYAVKCGHCDEELDEEFAEDDQAIAFAKQHKSEHPTHFPRAIDTETEERIYG